MICMTLSTKNIMGPKNNFFSSNVFHMWSSCRYAVALKSQCTNIYYVRARVHCNFFLFTFVPFAPPLTLPSLSNLLSFLLNLLREFIIDSLSVERNHVLVRVSVVGGASERKLPPRTLQEVSCTLLFIVTLCWIGTIYDSFLLATWIDFFWLQKELG